MSSVSSVGQDLYQYLWSTKSTGKSSSSSDVGESSQFSMEEVPQGAPQGAPPGPPPGGQGDMMKKIESAVTDALKSAQSDGSSSTDLNQTIQDAIASVLKDNAPGSTTQASGTDSQGSDDTDATGDVEQSGKSDHDAFIQLLQANGIDAKQFGADMRAAMQQVMGDTSGQSSGYSQTGNLLDAIA